MAEDGDRLSLENVTRLMEGYLTTRTQEDFPWIVKGPEDVECRVSAVIYGDHRKRSCLCGHQSRRHNELGCKSCSCPRFVNCVRHVGKLDLLGRMKHDPRILCDIDHKTTYRIDARFLNQFQQDSQVTGYLYDLSQMMGVEPTTVCAFINAIEVQVVPGSTRQCKEHGVPYSECGVLHIKTQIVGPIQRTEQQFVTWQKVAYSLALRYHLACGAPEVRTWPQEGPFSGGCGYCEFREWCLADRKVDLVHRMFEETPWVHEGFDNLKGTETTLFIDNSTLKATAACTTQALMRYYWGYSNAEQKGPLQAGTAVHAALEAWWKGKSKEECLQALANCYNKA